jgi:hypothetical protein
MDRQAEEEHLRKANADIAKAHDCVERQRLLVARLQDHGHDTTTAIAVLQTMRETLHAMEQHRQTILKELSAQS